ncbi:hypothetical protein PV327_007293 [Microctonus hyperodae]|uniref:Uncharacterized protein n=1 Tax=Microctonus hyperodae TaxID=165561 RepID=A0AA39KJD7_MICHY|nr:hypothetical protein PV327_007293 [Microctonus hyperodae]
MCVIEDCQEPIQDEEKEIEAISLPSVINPLAIVTTTTSARGHQEVTRALTPPTLAATITKTTTIKTNNDHCGINISIKVTIIDISDIIVISGFKVGQGGAGSTTQQPPRDIAKKMAFNETRKMFAAMVLHKNTKHTNKSSSSSSSSSSYFLSGSRNSNKNDNNNHQSNLIDNHVNNNNVNNNDNSNNGNHLHNRNQQTFNASTF